MQKMLEKILCFEKHGLMRLGFQKLTSELKTESRIIPIAKRIGIGSIPRCFASEICVQSSTLGFNTIYYILLVA